MAIDIDGFAVLRSIAAESRTFIGVAAEAAKAARELVVKQITAKNAGLESLRDVRKALGTDTFTLILDGMKDAQIKPLVSKLDKNHPNLKGSSPDWRLNQLRELANGSIEPTPKPEPIPKDKKGKKVSSGSSKSSAKKEDKEKGSDQEEALELISFRSAGATRKRGK